VAVNLLVAQSPRDLSAGNLEPCSADYADICTVDAFATAAVKALPTAAVIVTVAGKLSTKAISNPYRPAIVAVHLAPVKTIRPPAWHRLVELRLPHRVPLLKRVPFPNRVLLPNRCERTGVNTASRRQETPAKPDIVRLFFIRAAT
jgi:hypothetical protein